MVFAPEELPPSDWWISGVNGIFQEQWVCPYKVWFADAKAPFLWLLIKRAPSFQGPSPELQGKCLYKAETEKIEKTEEAVTAGCPNTAALVFLTENLRCHRALSTPTIFVFIPAHTSLAVSLHCSQSAQRTWQWERKAALCSQGQEGKKGIGFSPAGWPGSEKRSPQKQAIWSYCPEWKHPHSKQMASFCLGHTRN